MALKIIKSLRVPTKFGYSPAENICKILISFTPLGIWMFDGPNKLIKDFFKKHNPKGDEHKFAKVFAKEAEAFTRARMTMRMYDDRVLHDES